MARETGVRKLTAFPLENNGRYGTAIPLKNCVALNTTNNYKEIEYYSDCTTEHSSATLQSVEISLEISSAMALDLVAKLTGQESANGKVATVVGAVVPQFALAYEILMDDNTTRRRVIYNCNLRKEEKANETESEGQIFTFVGKGLPVEIEGKQYVDLMMSESEIEAMVEGKEQAKAEYAKFFTEVIKPGAGAAA